MKTLKCCSACGAPLPVDAPAGLCPVCLLKTEAPTLAQASPGIPSRPILQPGAVFGDYKILRLLGAGGMGEVFEAQQLSTGRRVALKLMGHKLGSEEDRRRFLREGRLAAAVNHPNVVYVHGSEEINEVPVIVMELAPGGTLKERLKTGPLPIAEAVEAILSVIDGLEAAAAAGVLHRDMKPANCFLGADGTVKVGDFGLSVSTLARGESLFTASGAVLGTPAYAAPEQLRGEELDVRADIYSIGATLYHLLTGHTPFLAKDFVHLITEVLDKEPPRPETLRAEIPAELSRILLRCLAKDRKARFQSYADLRHALLPFSEVEPEPARPSRRFLAGLVDDLLAYGPSMIFMAYLGSDPLDYFTRERTLSAGLIWVPFCLWYIAYYALPEGRWGAALGKAMLGLRVVGPGGRNPGIARAAARAAIYILPYLLPSFALVFLMSRSEVAQAYAEGRGLVTDWLWFPLWALIFCTMRRRNGYAALQDLLTRTRVVLRPQAAMRPPLPTAVEQPPVTQPGKLPPHAFGPYQAQQCLWRDESTSLWLGLDPILRRAVWIHVHAGTEPSLGSARRDLARPGRLRWLNAGGTGQEQWNVFEAMPGAPFLSERLQGSEWLSWRFWMLDLAEEAVDAMDDPSAAPTLALNRVWITAQGRAVLLDFLCPGLPSSTVSASHDLSAAGLQAFLDEFAERAQKNGPRPSPLPLPAQQFLASLKRKVFEKGEYVVGNLQSLVNKPAELNRWWRAASLALVPGVLLVLSLQSGLMMNFELRRWDRAWQMAYPDKPPLRIAAEVYEHAAQSLDPSDPRDLEMAQAYLTAHFGELLTNQNFYTYPHLGASLPQRDLLQGIFSQPSSPPSPELLQEAERVMGRRVARKVGEEHRTVRQVTIALLAASLCLLPLISLTSILLFRVNPIHRLFGITAVDRTGQPATRRRLLLRWIFAWPLFMVSAVVGILLLEVPNLWTPMSDTASRGGLVCLWITALLLLGAAIYAAGHPRRSLADRCARTWLVRS